MNSLGLDQELADFTCYSRHSWYELLISYFKMNYNFFGKLRNNVKVPVIRALACPKVIMWFRATKNLLAKQFRVRRSRDFVSAPNLGYNIQQPHIFPQLPNPITPKDQWKMIRGCFLGLITWRMGIIWLVKSGAPPFHLSAAMLPYVIVFKMYKYFTIIH